jgi:hypothetical protein
MMRSNETINEFCFIFHIEIDREGHMYSIINHNGRIGYRLHDAADSIAVVPIETLKDPHYFRVHVRAGDGLAALSLNHLK